MLMISACVIVKNEAENLPKWLESMKQFADELIVVDTGSTDATVAIAQAGGAKVYHFPWINDFSAAKNYAIEQATGDWLTFLDADEYFSVADVGKVRTCAKRYHKDKEVAGLLFRLINIDKVNGQDMGTSFYKPLLFRNEPWIRYRGAIHETVYNLDRSRKQRMEYVPEITVYHTGYSPEVMQEKAKRDLSMLLDRQQKGGMQPLDAFHLMDCYYSLKQYDRAAEFAEQAVVSEHKPVGQEIRPYTVLIQSLMLLGKSSREIVDAAERAVADYPQAAELWMLWGVQDWRMKDYLMADQHLHKGYTLCQREAGSPAMLFLPLVCEYLGEIALWRHCRIEAAQYFIEGLQHSPRTPSLLQKLCEALAGEDSVEFIACLNKLYDKKEDSAFLTQVLAETNQSEACLYYDRLSGGVLDDNQRYIISGHSQAAAGLILQRLDSLAVLGRLSMQTGTPSECQIMERLLPPDCLQLPDKAVTLQQLRQKKKLLRIKEYFCL